ncbi:ABC transporter permease [Opitutus terrae]|uniref:Permease n=1 Tax=Opitutus terrae (strain DSM 11246 / JCM 15787 / PB90-1) TaxID=452637 RepID=B1ZXW6_OPITP|nr:ABC transporter permease [Opitutus terrae]ACB75168.1 permease [Opitutus terrae PB90-1]
MPSVLSRVAFTLGTIGIDLRIGARMLAKEKAFCAIAAGVLALGIGAVTTQFAVVNGVLLRGFSFPDADRLVTVQFGQSTTELEALVPRIMPADLLDLQARQMSFDSLAGWLLFSAANVNLNGATERRAAGYVTHDFFRMLGIRPVLGRDFTAEDDRDGAAPTIILGDALWRELFESDPNVIGRSLRVNGRVGTIIGVMPRGFAFPYDEQLWIALRTESPVRPRHEHANRPVIVYGRLKPGVTLAQASAEVSLIAAQLAKEHPENAALKTGQVQPLLAAFTTPRSAGLLYTLLAFSLGVLLIACVNVANMQFARATLRLRELAIRASFGATRARLLRQLLTENLLLALVGAALGTLLALWTVGWLDSAVRAFRPPLPGWMRFSIDGPVLTTIVAATLFATVGSGLLPGLMAARVGLAAELKEGGRGATSRRTGVIARVLVVLQIVVTCILLIGSLLQLRSIERQQHIDHGYDPTAVMSARYMLMAGDHPTEAARIAFNEKVLAELRVHPSLASAAFSERYRMISVPEGPVEIEGQTAADEASQPIVASERITDGYFATLGQPILAGRDFRPEESDLKLPVAIVNATFARLHFPNGDALGRRFRSVNPNPKTPEPWRVIVGIVADVRMSGPFDSRAHNSGYYLPFTSNLYNRGQPTLSGMSYVTVIVRPRDGIRAEASLQAIREAVAKVDPDMPIYYTGTPQAQFETYLGQSRLITLLSLAVGIIAVALAAAGLYGVTAHAVNRRRQEFGIRLALGADRRQLLTLVLRQAGRQVALGLVLGLAATGAIALTARSAIAGALFETNPFDPLTYAAVALLLGGIALLATFLPARRVTKVDPMIALRAE